MTPERWQRINEIYHSALELDVNRRAPFLHEACAGDPMLLDEVESLIASHDQAGSLIEEPALKVAARILSGETAASLAGRTSLTTALCPCWAPAEWGKTIWPRTQNSIDKWRSKYSMRTSVSTNPISIASFRSEGRVRSESSEHSGDP